MPEEKETKTPEGKAQVEKTIQTLKEAAEKMAGLADEAQSAEVQKRIGDAVYVLESMQNKIFFKTKASLNFTMPALSSAEHLLEAIEDLAEGTGEISAVLDELEGLETNVDTLKVKVASQDIIIT